MKSKKILKLSTLITMLLATLSPCLIMNEEAKATSFDDVSSDPYRTRPSTTDTYDSYKISLTDKQINLSTLRYDNPLSKPLAGVGILSNTRTKHYGSAFVVGSHTILTNNHVVERTFGETGTQSKYEPEQTYNLRYLLARDGDIVPYRFKVKKITMMRNTDIAIIETYEKLSNFVKPLSLASKDEVNSLKFGSNIYTAGYPLKNYMEPYRRYDQTYKVYRTAGEYLKHSSSFDNVFYYRAITRKGASGSPILSPTYKVLGVLQGGWNNLGSSTTMYAKQEMALGFYITDDIRQKIQEIQKSY